MIKHKSKDLLVSGSVFQAFSFIFVPFFFSVVRVTAETSGGQMMSFIDKRTAYRRSRRTMSPFFFCLDSCAHLPSLLAALSNKWRCKKGTNRVQIWFSSIGNRAFFCGAVSHLPSDVRRRNDTNCILPLWNTISGWRDGELIHLLAWSFKRGASILIWRDSSAPLLIRTKKSRSTSGGGGGEPSDSKWSDL